MHILLFSKFPRVAVSGQPFYTSNKLKAKLLYGTCVIKFYSKKKREKKCLKRGPRGKCFVKVLIVS